MPGVTPQPPIHDPPPVVRVGLEGCHLRIRNGLEEPAHKPERDPEPIEQPESRAHLVDRRLDRPGDDPQDDGLQPEDQVQALIAEGRTAVGPHGRVAFVLTDAPMPITPGHDVGGQSDAPKADQGGHQPGTPIERRGEHEGHPGDQDETGSPEGIHDADVIEPQADQPTHEHEGEEDAEVDGQ